jgi:hypothetical protein
MAMISGDHFGIQDDNDSCFNPTHGTPCNSVNAPNLVDQLESKHISREGLFESMPSIGFLGASFPTSANRLYAQKHNPFSTSRTSQRIPRVSTTSNLSI